MLSSSAAAATLIAKCSNICLNNSKKVLLTSSSTIGRARLFRKHHHHHQIKSSNRAATVYGQLLSVSDGNCRRKFHHSLSLCNLKHADTSGGEIANDGGGQNNNTTRNEDILQKIERMNDILEMDPMYASALVERANLYIELCDWKKASADLEKVIDQFSSIINTVDSNIVIQILWQLYELYNKHDNYNVQKATFYLEKAFEIESNHSVQLPRLEYYQLLYALHYEMGQFERAIFYVTEGIKSMSSRTSSSEEMGSGEDLASLFARRGQILIDKYNMIERGRKDLEMALSLAPINYSTIVLMLHGFSHAKLNEQVLQTYEIYKQDERKAGESSLSNTDEEILKQHGTIHKLMSNYHQQRKEYKLALECFRKYLYYWPIFDPAIYSELRYLCLIVGDVDGYISSVQKVFSIYKLISNELIEQVLKGRPTASDSRIDMQLQYSLFLSSLYLADHQVEKAIQVCESTAMKELLEKYKPEMSPDPIPVEHFRALYHSILSFCYLLRGDDSLVDEHSSKAFKYFPVLLKHIGVHYYNQSGKNAEGRKYVMKYYDETQDLQALCEVSAYFIDDKDYEGSIRESERVLKIDPNNCHALFNMGEAFFHLGDLIRAKEYFKRSLAESEKQQFPYGKDLFNKALLELWPQYFELKE